VCIHSFLPETALVVQQNQQFTGNQQMRPKALSQPKSWQSRRDKATRPKAGWSAKSCRICARSATLNSRPQ
jgi:hypothetical protein